MTRPILTLKKQPAAVMPPATEAPKRAPDKTQQEATSRVLSGRCFTICNKLWWR